MVRHKRTSQRYKLNPAPGCSDIWSLRARGFSIRKERTMETIWNITLGFVMGLIIATVLFGPIIMGWV